MVEHSPAERRALIVEDETLFAMSLAVDMQALGFANCDLAATGQDAFLKAMEDQPDIVLMKINLEGGREGIEAARWLREVCDIPIVFVTAYTDRDAVARIPDPPYFFNLCVSLYQVGKFSEALTACDAVANNGTAELKTKADRMAVRIKDEAKRQQINVSP